MKMKKLACLAAVVTAVGVGVFLAFDDTKPGPEAGVESGLKLIAEARPSRPSSASAAPWAFQLASNQTATVRGTKPYVLTSNVPFQKSLRVAAEKLGARTVGVLSDTSLLVEADDATRARLSADARFSGATEYVPSSKLSPELMAALSAGAESVQVAVVTLAAADRLPVQRRITAAGGEILKGCLNSGDSFRATLSAKTVCDLVASGDVRWMEMYERPQLLNNYAVEPAAMNVTSVWASVGLPTGLSGTNQVISTSDSGIDLCHQDLTNQVIKTFVSDGCDESDVQGHGTHTAGSIVGDGTMSTNEIRGVAWGAKLLAWFCGKKSDPRAVFYPTDYAKLFRPDEEQKAYIHSASWGSSQDGKYTDDCQKIDEFVWMNPDFLPVFSAGNDGSAAGTVGSPAAAKNVLSVGATQSTRKGTYGGHASGNPDKTADFSSRGPCQDGRIKPEICAPGVGILSTRAYGMEYSYGIGSNTNYAYDCGTSMSCPLTAGAVALVREWLQNYRGFTNDVDETGVTVVERVPTAALMKAVITGGAKGAECPGNEQGWGRVDLAETLFPTDGREVKLIDRIPFAEGMETSIVIRTNGQAPLDVQLAWIDYPGDSAKINDKQLVNDLDLTVEELEGGDGRVNFGNGGVARDSKNNLESVRLGTASAGLYLITINCSRILHDHTEGGAAALYVRGLFDPDEEVRGAERVRIVTDGGAKTNGYFSLDKVLSEVKAGETIEILKPVNLRKTCTNLVDCTIMATNGVPADALVKRVNGAKLVVADGAKLVLSNVAFSASSDALVDVLKGGRLVLGAAVGLGVDANSVAVTTETADGFMLACALTQALTLDCMDTSAQHVGETFGVYDAASFADVAEADASARMIVNANFVNREVRGHAADDGTLVWKEYDQCPLEDAAGYFIVGDETNAYARLDKVIDKMSAAQQSGKTVAEFVVLKSDALSRSLTVSGALTLRGVGKPEITCAASSGFTVVSNGNLTVDGLSFDGGASTGFRKGSLFLVDGGELTLGPDVVIHDIVNGLSSDSLPSPALHVKKGKATVNGATFARCENRGMAGGGAISVGEPSTWKEGDYELVLNGGCITNCSARVSGGGVYAYNKAKVTVGGTLRVSDNVSGTSMPADDDDIFIAYDDVAFTVAGDLQPVNAGIGVRCGFDDGNAVGGSFVKVSGPGVLAAARYTFFNDTNPTLGVGLSADGKTLVWTAAPDPDYSTDDPGLAVVRVSRVGSALDGKAYGHLAYALEALEADGSSPATLELLKDASIVENSVVGFPLTVCSTGETAFVVSRSATAQFVVTDALTLTNVVFDGVGDVGLFNVNAGSLTLQAGVVIRDVTGSVARDSGAVTVWNGGTFTLESGAAILNCANRYRDVGTDGGYGGALLMDNATAYLRGGVISNCVAGSAGGVFANNESKVYVSGDLVIADNRNLAGKTDNLRISEDSQLWVDGPFTGMVGYTEGVRSSSADSNVFGYAKSSAGLTEANIADAARCFVHDVTGDRGQAVHTTGSSSYRLVWSAAIGADGTYGRYVYVGNNVGTPVAIAKPTAVAGLVYTGEEQIGVLEKAGYSVVSNRATNAGNYQAVATLNKGFVWVEDDTTDPIQTSTTPVSNTWSIAKTDYDLSGITFVTNYVYDGTAKRVSVEGTLPVGVTWQVLGVDSEIGWTDAGSYPVTVRFAAEDLGNFNPISDRGLWVVIAKATYDMSGVVFADGEFQYNGTPRSLFIAGTLPKGVTNVVYEGNGQVTSGVYTVTAKFFGDTKNHELIEDMTAKLTITPNPLMPDEKIPEYVTVEPGPIAFKSITRVNETTWELEVTNIVEFCNYRLLYTDDLSKGFTVTGGWQQATAPMVPTWTTNVVTSGEQQLFWKAEATDGEKPVK